MGCNLDAFEEWCADEMGNTVNFIKEMRKINIVGAVHYDRDEIEKRYRAWSAAMRHAAKIVLEAK
ncbi:hypothetical protein RFD78_000791 [Klebsiella aerogenes]|nr:hypothetical protein [Klebsiella aerogenes]ELA0226269.1 hypothetical protein [Klebsiella aerogenes]